MSERFESSAPDAIDPEVIAQAEDAMAELATIGRKDNKAVPRQIGFDKRHQLPIFEEVYPCVFNEDGTPYFNTEEDMAARAKAAQVAANTRQDKVSNRDGMLVSALGELSKRDASSSIAYIEGLSQTEREIYLAAEKLGQKRKSVLKAFGVDEGDK